MTNFRKEAHDRNCPARIPGICNHNPETTVLAYYRMSDSCGIGIKPPDTQGAFSCSACHDAIDGRIKTEFTRDELRLYHVEGMFLTQQILLDEGKL